MSRIANALPIIKKHEGLRLKSYLCPAQRWTIGYGNTFLEDGKPVTQGMVIDKERAETLLRRVVTDFAMSVTRRLKVPVSDNQFAALLSFAYNVGVKNFERSTLLRKVNANPNDPTIRNEFSRWTRANGRVLQGLVNRRNEEANLYFTK